VEQKKVGVDFFETNASDSPPFDPKLMFFAFLKFRFRSIKLVQNLHPRAVLATCGAKKLAVDFFEMNAPNPPRLT
jgi:hypothetical protein